jgi:predicted DNA-binding transcriptional regulator AlpA
VLPTRGALTRGALKIAFPKQEQLCEGSTRFISAELHALAERFPKHIRLTDDLVGDYKLELFLENDLAAAKVYARAFLEFWVNNKLANAQPSIITDTDTYDDPLVKMLDDLAREPRYDQCVFWCFQSHSIGQKKTKCVRKQVLQLRVSDLSQFGPDHRSSSHQLTHCRTVEAAVGTNVRDATKLKQCPNNIKARMDVVSAER